jgi:uncharacterized protein YecT (DUF1311 family)
MKLALPILVSMLLGVSTSQDRAIPYEQTQLGMNQAAGKELQAAEADMATVLDRLMKQAAGKADAIAKLNKAQTAWKSYRDAQLDAMWPFPEHGQYGSVHPMCVATTRTALTKTRVIELHAMLERVDGNVCNSAWPE